MEITPTNLKELADAAFELLNRGILSPERERALKRLFNAANLLCYVIEVEEAKGEEGSNSQ